MDIQIDPEFAAVIPPLESSELTLLRLSILQDGCRDPLVLWGDILVDGHNRYKICQDHGLLFQTVAKDFPDRDAALLWIIDNQCGRRNLNAYQRTVLHLKKEDVLAGQARERQLAGLKQNATVEQNSAQRETPQRTRDVIAKAANVSHDTVAKVKKIEATATPEVKAKLRTGDVSINAAYTDLNKPHVAQNAGESEWYTPARIARKAQRVMGCIDLDPASTAVANETVEAARYFTKEQDGLSQEWAGAVYMNPPYAQPLIALFTKKLCGEIDTGRVTQAVVLVNNATETRWFQTLAAKAQAICFPKGRVRFWQPDKEAAPLQGQAVCYYGDNHNGFLAEFGPIGLVVTVDG